MNLVVALVGQAESVLRRGTGSAVLPGLDRPGAGKFHSLDRGVRCPLRRRDGYVRRLRARAGQVVYSAVKVPLLLIATFLLSLPTFFVLNTLLGLRADLGRVVASLLATQACITVILASLAPITAFWYVSGSAYQPAILFNGLMFAVASLSAQWMLRRDYRPLIERHPAHRWMLRTWIVIYVFVGIQMAWVLRPFIGDPHAPVQFFREDSWSNAYLVVLEMVWKVLTRGN